MRSCFLSACSLTNEPVVVEGCRRLANDTPGSCQGCYRKKGGIEEERRNRRRKDEQDKNRHSHNIFLNAMFATTLRQGIDELRYIQPAK